jgi:drug/metabolite transporter (DMT)-like permease|uniref:DMT family transporter n=1 Tax=candidate division WOR-3 bacterium TaxID=2052148 RepID=A0A7C6EAB9_UNCW3
MSQFKIVLVLGFGLVVLSFASILIKLTQAPSIVIAAGRLTIASLVLTPFFWTKFPKIQLELRRVKLSLIFLSGLFLALHFFFWIESLSHTSVPSSVALVTTNPIFVAILSPIILKERITFRIGLAVNLGAIGSIIITSQGLNSLIMTKGNLLALAGAVCAGGYMIVGRRIRPHISLISYIYIMYTTAAILLLLGILITGQRLIGYSWQAYLFIILLALGPQLIGHTSFNWALGYLTAPVVAMTILGEPIGTTILSWLILNQPPTMREITGGVIIGIGIYLAASSERRKIYPDFT